MIRNQRLYDQLMNKVWDMFAMNTNPLMIKLWPIVDNLVRKVFWHESYTYAEEEL